MKDTKDSRRMFANEFDKADQRKLIKWLDENKSLESISKTRSLGKIENFGILCR
ncbi:hypothetical protein [Flavobacterium sp. CS20]|uniref:hypothetical protein n=1 Tax=Flavobacterium sp. CS20 TaxID=2775246 RepID=UPI0035303E04